MTEPVVITLLGEPQGKGRPRIGRMANGRPIAFTPAATRSYETALRVAATHAMGDRAMLEGPVTVEMVATFPVPASWSGVQRRRALFGSRRPTTKPDLDNLLKTLDAFNQVVWADDRQVVEATVSKLYGTQPGLTVTVRELVAVEHAAAPAKAPVEDLPLMAAG